MPFTTLRFISRNRPRLFIPVVDIDAPLVAFRNAMYSLASSASSTAPLVMRARALPARSRIPSQPLQPPKIPPSLPFPKATTPFYTARLALKEMLKRLARTGCQRQRFSLLYFGGQSHEEEKVAGTWVRDMKEGREELRGNGEGGHERGAERERIEAEVKDKAGRMSSTANFGTPTPVSATLASF
ncbi:hypothetical protein V5O48_010854 [Marasmius crinis-equi]|uniref:Uncharacterized protein n=1 Tax=Marasmius crinis-equi TaxID=585013 RepID=A0ABR3F7B3_9AGAR